MKTTTKRSLVMIALMAAHNASALAQSLPPALNPYDKNIKIEASPNNPFKKAGSEDVQAPPIIGTGDYQGALPLELLMGTKDPEQAPRLVGKVDGKPIIFYEGKFVTGQDAQDLYSEAQVAKLVKDRKDREAKLKAFLATQKKAGAPAQAKK